MAPIKSRVSERWQYSFLDGLDGLGQTYVAEVPCTFFGWAKEPVVLCRPTPQGMRRKGGKRRFPRLSATAASVNEVRNLLNYSPAFRGQAWMPIHIKKGEKGAMVSEVKAVRFFMRRDKLPPAAPGSDWSPDRVAPETNRLVATVLFLRQSEPQAPARGS